MITIEKCKLSVREANYLIATFMGYEIYKQTDVVIKDSSEKFVLCYDSMWSELMPVIEKIESIKINHWDNTGLYYVTISQCACKIHKLIGANIVVGYGYTKIQAAFEAVTNFIIWYNANKTPTP